MKGGRLWFIYDYGSRVQLLSLDKEAGLKLATLVVEKKSASSKSFERIKTSDTVCLIPDCIDFSNKSISILKTKKWRDFLLQKELELIFEKGATFPSYSTFPSHIDDLEEHFFLSYCDASDLADLLEFYENFSLEISHVLSPFSCIFSHLKVYDDSLPLYLYLGRDSCLLLCVRANFFRLREIDYELSSPSVDLSEYLLKESSMFISSQALESSRIDCLRVRNVSSRIDLLYLAENLGLKLCEDKEQGAELDFISAGAFSIFQSNEMLALDLRKKARTRPYLIELYSDLFFFSFCLLILSILFLEVQSRELELLKKRSFTSVEMCLELKSKIQEKEVLLEVNDALNSEIKKFKKLQINRNFWELFLSDIHIRIIRVQDVWFDGLECVDYNADKIEISLEGRMLDRDNPLKKVSDELKNRVQFLFKTIGESNFVQSIENESLDTSQNGMVRFRIRLILHANPPLTGLLSNA